MKETEYLIVGDGYAALFFAHRLIKNGKNFVLFSEGKKSASQVSAGIVNPAVLKKFTTFWKAQEQIESLRRTLDEIAIYTSKNFFINKEVHRIFHDENERNLWLKKSQTPELENFLSRDFVKINQVENPFFTGKVLQSARLDVAGFFSSMFQYLDENHFLIKEKFNYKKLNPETGIYGDLKFKNIIFAEGMGVKENPFFSEIPVLPNKGHHLKVKMPQDFTVDVTLKKKHFLFPVSEEEYYYGGTYDRDQLNHEIDETAISQLQNGLQEFYRDDFIIKEKCFGFRPTVRDRRPILGRHQKFPNLYVFNGLGARGVLNGNYFADDLFNLIEKNIPLPAEVDLKRFDEVN